MINRIWLYLVVMAVGLCNAQQYELGKVTKEELEQKRHAKDSSAVAAILFDVGKSTFEYTEENGFILVTEVKTKIKIYKKEGYEWANKAVSYYTGDGGQDKLNFSDAASFNLVDGKVVKTKLKSEGIFTEKVNKYWSQKKITMPNVREGSIIEYTYTIHSPRIATLSDWDFQTNIPIDHSEYTSYIPEYLVYSTRMKGFLTPKVANSSQMRKMTISYMSKDVPGMNSPMPRRITDEIEFKESIVKYSMNDIPALKDESYVNNIENYISSVEHELSVTKYPNSPIKTYSSTWESLVKTIYDGENFGPELNRTGYFEEDIKPIIAGALGNGQKTLAIFNFVRDRMNWNGYQSYNCEGGVRKAYKEKIGNIAEINLMLTAMLRHAGIPANPVLVSTRSNGISFFPNHSAYNYVVCAVESDNNVILLDATDKNALPNIIPVRALNWSGRIIRENGSSAEVNLMPKATSKDIINMIATLDSQGKLTGKIRDQYFDYNAMLYRDHYAGAKKESYLENLEKKLDGLEISDDFTVSYDDFSKPVTESYSFTHGSASEIIGDKIYFSPLLFFTESENPFKQDKREYPVDFIFPHQDKYMLTINLPEGYTVESMPAASAVNLGDGVCKFAFNISSNGKQIQVVSSVEVNESIISAEDYPSLRDFYKTMIAKQNEKVVLRKI